MRAQKEAPAPIGEVVEALLKKLGLERRFKESQISFQWRNWVGSSIAAHAKPYRVVNQKLVVYVDNSVWVSELTRHYKTWILKRIQTALGDGVVKEIIFKVGEAPLEEPKEGMKFRGKTGSKIRGKPAGKKLKKKEGEPT